MLDRRRDMNKLLLGNYNSALLTPFSAALIYGSAQNYQDAVKKEHRLPRLIRLNQGLMLAITVGFAVALSPAVLPLGCAWIGASQLWNHRIKQSNEDVAKRIKPMRNVLNQMAELLDEARSEFLADPEKNGAQLQETLDLFARTFSEECGFRKSFFDPKTGIVAREGVSTEHMEIRNLLNRTYSSALDILANHADPSGTAIRDSRNN